MTISDAYSLTDMEQSRFAQVQRLGESGSQNVTDLLKMLTDPSWMIRRAVVEALAQMGEPAVHPLLYLLRTQRENEARIAAIVDALSASRGKVEDLLYSIASDRDPAIVADVAQILGRRRSAASIPTLIQLTQHENDNVSVGAIEALGRIGGRAAVEALIETVRERNFFRVFPAIDVLGRSQDPRVVAPLAELLYDPMYLPEACRALGRSGEKIAVTPLTNLLASSSDAVVRVAALALSDLRNRYEEKSGGDVVVIDELMRTQIKNEMVRRLGRLLPQSDSSEAAAIADLLGIVGDAEIAPVLTRALELAGPVALNAAAALKKIGRDADTSLLEAIHEGSSERRGLLLPLVARAANPKDIISCLDDAEPSVRALACDTFARLGKPNVVAHLFPLLADDNLRVVHAATAAIQTLGSRESLNLAVEAASSASPVVRRSALRILSYFGDASALKPLLKGLNDPDPRVREAAIHGLPALEETEAQNALYRCAQSDEPRMRALSMRALGQISNVDSQVTRLLMDGLTDSDSWTRYYACQSLGRLKIVEAASKIAELLNDEAGQVRVAAVEALSHFDSPVAHQALRKTAAGDELEVRRAALVGLGILHRPEDLSLLLSASTSDDSATKLMALSALSKFPEAEVLPALRIAAADASEQVSSSAIGILGSRPEQEATAVLVDLLLIPRLCERVKAALLHPSEGRAEGLLIALATADDELAASLVSLLSRLQRPEARTALLAAIRLNNQAARKAAAPVLAARRDSEMIAAVRDAADNDPDPQMRQICSLLVGQ